MLFANNPSVSPSTLRMWLSEWQCLNYFYTVYIRNYGHNNVINESNNKAFHWAKIHKSQQTHWMESQGVRVECVYAARTHILLLSKLLLYRPKRWIQIDQTNQWRRTWFCVEANVVQTQTGDILLLYLLHRHTEALLPHEYHYGTINYWLREVGSGISQTNRLFPGTKYFH